VPECDFSVKLFILAFFNLYSVLDDTSAFAALCDHGAIEMAE